MHDAHLSSVKGSRTLSNHSDWENHAGRLQEKWPGMDVCGLGTGLHRIAETGFRVPQPRGLYAARARAQTRGISERPDFGSCELFRFQSRIRTGRTCTSSPRKNKGVTYNLKKNPSCLRSFLWPRPSAQIVPVFLAIMAARKDEAGQHIRNLRLPTPSGSLPSWLLGRLCPRGQCDPS